MFPKFEDLVLTDAPREGLGIENYEEVRQSVVDHFSACKDVVSLYEFGTVSAPSISDIDLLVVLCDKPGDEIHKCIERTAVDPQSQYLMMDNTLMVVNEQGFHDIPLWDDMQFKLLYGKEIEQAKLEGDDLYYTEIARVLDWLPERTLRLVELFARKEVPVRVTLCVVNSFIYAVRRLRDFFGIALDGIDSYIEDFRELRTNWHFVEDNERQLYEFICRGIEMGFQGIRAFDTYLCSKGLYGSNKPEIGTFRLNPIITTWTTKQMFYHFTRDFLYINPQESLLRSSDSEVVVVIPSLYHQHLSAYASVKGPIGNGIQKSLTPSLPSWVDPRLEEILRGRMAACNKMATFLRENNINRGLLKFGWFL